MNWDAIGAVGEVLGAVAVFISLLYLALQIRNSRRTDQIIAAAQTASSVEEWIGQIVRDGELYALYRKGLTDYDSLEPNDRGRFSLLILQFLRSMEVMWLQRNHGAIDDEYWSGMKVAIGDVISTSGGSKSFARYRRALDPGFVKLVEQALLEVSRE